MKRVKVAGNGFANPPPKKDRSGRTAQEFAEELFQFIFCEECGKDADNHIFVIGPVGLWFAKCNILRGETHR